MKKFTLNWYWLPLSFFLFFTSAVSAQQSDSSSITNKKILSVVHIKPGQTSGNKTIITPYTLVGNEVRIFPSSNPQSEIHLSVNKVNPQLLLLSSNTYLAGVTYRGAFWSTDGGGSWTGAEILPNNTPGRGDPSTAFDASGNGYIASMTPDPAT